MLGRRSHLVLVGTVLAASALLVIGLAHHGPIGEERNDATPNASTHQAADEDHAHHGVPEGNPASLSAHQPRHDDPFPDRETNASTPTRAEASNLPHQFKRFIVHTDEGLDEMREDGYITGNGTQNDPYLISGFRVTQRIEIQDTTKPLIIENTYIEGQLKLNFNGPHVHVHHNHIEDLRVNENIERTERATGGLIEQNTIPFIGQMRHFSGTFAHNDVGPKPNHVIDEYLSDTGAAVLPDHVTFLLDGYHLAHVHNNTIDGHMEIKLHGHYHGSCLACAPHHHANPDTFPPSNKPHPDLEPQSQHSYRYHTLDLENNTYTAEDETTALSIHDRAHAGDDQTANSEPNGHLEERHDHHQYVRIAHNSLTGASMLFDIVNAHNTRHEGMTQHAHIDLEGNHVTLEKPRGDVGFTSAYTVHAADNADVEAKGNTFTFEADENPLPEGYAWIVDGEPAETTGFHLRGLNATNVTIAHTHGEGAHYGVTLQDLHESPLSLEENRFQAQKEDRHEH